MLREGQKLDPGHPTLQNNLGFSLLERGGDLDEAARLIKSALDQDPKNSSTMDSWGWVLFKQGKFTEAEAALRKAAQMSPFSPEVHRHLGEALLKLDRLQDALDEWERALAFAFPDRKALEDQVQGLRTRLAKSPGRRRATTPAPCRRTTVRDDTDDEEGEPMSTSPTLVPPWSWPGPWPPRPAPPRPARLHALEPGAGPRPRPAAAAGPVPVGLRRRRRPGQGHPQRADRPGHRPDHPGAAGPGRAADAAGGRQRRRLPRPDPPPEGGRQRAATLAAVPLPFFPQLGSPDALYQLLAEGAGTGREGHQRDARAR